jgi:transcriptional regulator with XRE-family HTH domain
MVVPVSYLRLPHLRSWRLRAGLSQEDLAGLAGISRSTVHNAEKGDEVLPSTLQSIAKALKIKPHELQRLPPD